MLASFLSHHLKNSNLIFFVAFLTGLIFGSDAPFLKELLLPTLILIMSLSTTQIAPSQLGRVRKYFGDIVLAFVINYLFLSGLILVASYLLVRDRDLHAGFVIMAAIPSAVSVLPFTYLLKGEMMVSLFGSVAVYLLALVMFPLISFVFLGVGEIDIYRFLYVLTLMIVVPFIISRILLTWRGFHRVRDKTDIFINLAFFLTIYVVVGINRSTFLTDFEILIPVSSIAFLRTFFSGHLIDFLFRMLGTDRERRMSYVLFGSYKNLTLAATIAFVLFNERAAIPSAVAIPFEFLFFVWFSYFQKRWG